MSAMRVTSVDPGEAAGRDASRCPLCGGPNHCTLAAGSMDEPCWCTQIVVSDAAIASVAPDDRARCLCPRCAAG
jgi:hypothetical protein